MTTDAHEALRSDPALGELVQRYGPLSIEPAADFYRRFVTSILRQQVSMASAAATRERLFDRIDVTPDGVLETDEEVLRDCGLSRQKARYVRNVAEAFRDRGWSKAYFEGMDDDAVRRELTSVTGVGEWTANMQLMFSLGRPDVFPVGDLGIRKGMRTLYGEVDREEMTERAERWRPYRSYASLYLWRIEEGIEDSVAEVTRG